MKKRTFGLISAIALMVCLAGCTQTAKIETVETIEAGSLCRLGLHGRITIGLRSNGCRSDACALLSLQQSCSEGATFRKHFDPNLGRELFGGRCRLGARV